VATFIDDSATAALQVSAVAACWTRGRGVADPVASRCTRPQQFWPEAGILIHIKDAALYLDMQCRYDV
jgi:hypothetical protein